ncbi:carbohydrate ABC transporter permease [Paenibacillus eucommiae]|uniref:Aldouronate transport system permease protein n=1 Tax=Paenibacillus eucommiae TaxID=1355755 RepID=A0ABS4J4W2_9BACL|nr:carbohydrate ABC transporter permease [Paenibacillus eucommiae]MBP1994291.1 putative aldouronate transport system permease protein [Paenibacillus eucommiae]
MKSRMTDRSFNVLNITFLAIIALITLFPIYYIFVVSFTDPDEYMTKGLVLFPQHWSLKSYQYLLSNSSFVRASGVSGFLASVGTLLSLTVTAAGAYALSRKRLTGRKPILMLILLTTLFQPGLIPPYLLMRDLGLINSIWALILPVLSSGWYVILMKGFFDSIPDSLEEAATIDGYSDLGIWFRIILPLSLPAMAAFGLFYAVAYWNTFFAAVLYINNPEKWPLQILLQTLLIDSSSTASGDIAQELASQQRLPSETLKMAAVVIATVPIMMVYPFLQKHFAKGAMVGSVKG